MAPRQRKQSSTTSADKKKIFFTKRLPGFKKKLAELPALCGNSAVCICYAPDGTTHVWSETKDNPRAVVSQILDKFNAQTNLKKKKNSCDVSDFSDLDGLCLEQLKSCLSGVDSHLIGVRQRESVVRKLKETEHHIRVSDNVTVSDHKLGSSEDVNGTELGFGGVLNDLGYVVLGSHESVTNDVSMVSKEVDAAVSSWLDEGGDHLSDYPMWESSLFSLPQLTTCEDDDDWMVSFMTNTENWGFGQGFDTQPLMLDS